MFGHIKRLFRDSAVYGMAETVSRGTGFILVFIYARVLNAEELGIRTAVYGASAFLGVFYTLGLDNAFLRYFMDEKYREKQKEIFTTVLFFSFLVGILFFLGISLNTVSLSSILTKTPEYSYLIGILFLILVFDTIVIYPSLILRAENKLFYYSAISFARFFLFIFVNILLVWYMQRGLRGVFEANMIVVLFVCMMLLPVFRRYLSPKISFPLLKKMLFFGVPTIFTILGLRILDISDRYVILYLMGPDGAAALGGYSVAYTLGMVGTLVFVNSFRIAWQPFFFSVKNKPEAKTVFSRITTYYALFIGLVFLSITLFRREIFGLYAPKLPGDLSDIVPFIAMAYIFYGFYLIMLAGIFIKDKTWYLPVVTLISAAANIAMNFYFVPTYGIKGAAYTTVLSFMLMACLMYLISSRVYSINYEFRRLGYILIATGLPVGLSAVFSFQNVFADFVLRVVFLFLPILYYLFGGFLTGEESLKLKSFMDRYTLAGVKHGS